MFQAESGSRRGFTLVELLVVIAIIGILIALLLPAVQAAREAARRSQCINNFKQVGLAMHNYHDTQKCFPPGMIFYWSVSNTECGQNDSGSYYGFGWALRVLPHMEQSQIYDQVDWNLASLYATGVNRTVGAYRVDAFLCPSDPQDGELVQVSAGWQTGSHADEDLRMTNMAGVSDSVNWTCSTTAPKRYPKMDGMMGERLGCKVAHVIDGTSNTLMIGEMTGGGPGTYRGQFWSTWNLLDTYDGINGIYTVPGNPNLTAYDMRRTGFSSYHPGGCNFLLADGSVHFLSETIDALTLRGLTTRGGKESVTLP